VRSRSGIILARKVISWSGRMNRPGLLEKSLIIVFAAALSISVAFAQAGEAAAAEDDAGRPKVGLVLSGGGARGGAHIGVLKALEELNVPVDFIAGTSVGAIVGAFYATGMSMEDLENVPRDLDLERALLNVTPRQYQSFRRKRDDDLFLVDMMPGLSDELEFELPIGLVHGQLIDMILTRLTMNASDTRDFDELAIPFRAVASDIVTGEAVVLADGNLSRAVRASMSLPAALAPVELDGRLLVDGGISMNLPIEVAIGMGADVVVAIDISAPMRLREEMRSVLDVTYQLSNLLTREGVEAQKRHLRDQDLLFTPLFPPDLSAVSYARMVETIPIGYEMIMAAREQFEPFALSDEDYRAYREERRWPAFEEPPVVEFVDVRNNSRIADSVIESRLRDIEVGEPFDVDTVEQAIYKVYGLDFFQNVRYDLVTENGRTGVSVAVDERSWGPNYLQLGLNYSASGDDGVLFGLAVSYLRSSINELGAEWRTTAKIGDEPALVTSLHQPLGSAARYFIAPELRFESTQLSLWGQRKPIATFQLREAMFELGVGRELEHFGELRVGLRRSYGDMRIKVGDPELTPLDRFNRGEVFARFSVDTLDNISFPRSGTLARLEWRGSRTERLSADSNFDQWLLSASHARTWGRHTLLSTFRYDVTTRGVAPLQSLSRLGGFLDLSGLNHNELAGQHAMRVGANYYRRIGDLALFPAFAGISFEVGNVWDNRRDIGLHNTVAGGSLWAGVDTPVGPIYVGYGRAERRQDAFYVFLGNFF
jgi:NTE family protein